MVNPAGAALSILRGGGWSLVSSSSLPSSEMPLSSSGSSSPQVQGCSAERVAMAASITTWHFLPASGSLEALRESLPQGAEIAVEHESPEGVWTAITTAGQPPLVPTGGWASDESRQLICIYGWGERWVKVLYSTPLNRWFLADAFSMDAVVSAHGEGEEDVAGGWFMEEELVPLGSPFAAALRAAGSEGLVEG